MSAERGRRDAGQGWWFADPLGPGGRRARAHRKRHRGGRSPGTVPAGHTGRAHGRRPVRRRATHDRLQPDGGRV